MEEGKELIRYFSVPCKATKANGGRTRNFLGGENDFVAGYQLGLCVTLAAFLEAGVLECEHTLIAICSPHGEPYKVQTCGGLCLFWMKEANCLILSGL